MGFRIIKLFSYLVLSHRQIFYASNSGLILLKDHLYFSLAFSAAISLVRSPKMKWSRTSWPCKAWDISAELLHHTTSLPFLPLRSPFSVTCCSSPVVIVPCTFPSAVSLSVKTRVSPLYQVLEILSTRRDVVSELFSVVVVAWVSLAP